MNNCRRGHVCEGTVHAAEACDAYSPCSRRIHSRDAERPCSAARLSSEIDRGLVGSLITSATGDLGAIPQRSRGRPGAEWRRSRADQAGAGDDDDLHGLPFLVDDCRRHVSSNAPPRKYSQLMEPYRSKIARFCPRPLQRQSEMFLGPAAWATRHARDNLLLRGCSPECAVSYGRSR